MTIISRVGFCQECQKQSRPRQGSFFCVSGEHGFHKGISNHRPTTLHGFTPHFYQLIKVLGENVIYEKSCGMHNCVKGGHFAHEKEGWSWTFDYFERIVCTIEEWNNIVRYKDKGYQL